MDFSFSSDQQDLRELAAKILGDATTLERTKQVIADSDGFDRTLWAALADAGIIGISLPGTGEEPVAPVYADGERITTLRGENIAAEFRHIIDAYVEKKFQLHS